MRTIENDLTQGSVFRKLWRFTLPLIGANLLQMLYGMVDLYIVGRFATTADVSAVSVSGTVISTFLMLLIGLGVGAMVVVGQKYGAGDRDAIAPVAATAFSLAWIAGVVLMVLVAALALPILRWINTPEQAFRPATAYMLICSVGYIFLAVYNMLSGILRGMGESKLPLLFVAVSSVVNIIGDVILIGGFGLGATGAAIATVFAQMLCVVFAIFFVKKRDFPFDFRPKSYRLVKSDASELLWVGTPVALQQMLVLFSFIIIEGIINRFGLNASAAAGILDKIFLVATIPTNAFQSAISAMVAQNIGAKEPKRAVRCLWYGSLLSEGFAVVFFLLGLFIPERLVGIFTADAGVITEGVRYFAGYKYEFIFCSLAFCVNGFINGTGHTKLTLVNNIISAYVIRLPSCFLVERIWSAGLLGLGYALPVASAVQVIVGYVFFASGRWKESARARHGETENELTGENTNGV